MNPTRPIDPRSALIGVGIAGSLVLLTSLAVPPSPWKTVRINLDPDPAAIVRVDEGEVYVVPNKERLVIKAVTGDGSRIMINGALVLNTFDGSLEFPLVAEAGDDVSVEEGFPNPNRNVYLTGYLVP